MPTIEIASECGFGCPTPLHLRVPIDAEGNVADPDGDDYLTRTIRAHIRGMHKDHI